MTTVVQNVNLRQTNVILGEEERTLYGPGFILDTLCGLSFRISSHSFYQVNAVQTEVLYRQAMELAGLAGTQTVVDAYCGTGTIGLVAAKSGAARVIGVDNVASAVRDARQNAVTTAWRTRSSSRRRWQTSCAPWPPKKAAARRRRRQGRPRVRPHARPADAESATALAPAVDIAGTPVPAP